MGGRTAQGVGGGAGGWLGPVRFQDMEFGHAVWGCAGGWCAGGVGMCRAGYHGMFWGGWAGCEDVGVWVSRVGGVNSLWPEWGDWKGNGVERGCIGGTGGVFGEGIWAVHRPLFPVYCVDGVLLRNWLWCVGWRCGW